MVVGGPFLPIAIIIYWVSNNIWTYGQQHLVFGKIARRRRRKEEALARRAANAPAPGAKPVKARKTASVEGAAPEGVVEEGGLDADAGEVGTSGEEQANGTGYSVANARPGARPKKRKR